MLIFGYSPNPVVYPKLPPRAKPRGIDEGPPARRLAKRKTGPLRDLSNERFGRLVVKRYLRSQPGALIYEAECDCGKVIEAQSCKLRDGQSLLSCGCLRAELRASGVWAKHWPRMVKEILAREAAARAAKEAA